MQSGKLLKTPVEEFEQRLKERRGESSFEMPSAFVKPAFILRKPKTADPSLPPPPHQTFPCIFEAKRELDAP